MYGRFARARRLRAGRTAGCIGLVLALLTTGCTNWSNVSPEQASTNGVVLAIYYSPQSYTWGEPGHVLLVDSSGASTSIQTRGMDIASLVWSKSGLYFSDTERDYLVAERLLSWSSPKTNMQESAFQLPDGTHVSLFNKGNVDGEYVEQLVVNDGSASVEHDVTGLNQAVAVCGSEVYGVAELTGAAELAKARAAGVDETARMPQMLTRLYPPPRSAGEGFIAAYATEEANYLTSDEACDSEGVMHYLVATREGETYQVYIRSWNTHTGAARQHRIVDVDGNPVLTLQTFGFPVASPRLTADGHLVWISEDGKVRSTDPRTGRTAVLWATGRALGPTGTAAFAFFGADMFILEASRSGTDLVLSRYETLTGRGGPVLTVPGVVGRETLSQVRRDFAVSPELITAAPPAESG